MRIILRTIFIVILILSPLLADTNLIRLDASRLRASQVSALDSWPTFHHDVLRSGYYAGLAPHSAKALWIFPTGGAIESSPVIANGTVYFGSADGYLYAVNESTGLLIWRVNVGAVSSSSPAIYEASVFVGSPETGRLFNVDALLGRIRWSVYVGNIIADLLVVNGRVYVSDYGLGNPGRFFSIDALSGAVVWALPLNETGVPAFWGGLVYVASHEVRDGSLYAINASTGSIVWSYRSQKGVFGVPAIFQGIVFAGAVSPYSSEFIAFNATTGGVIWKNNIFGGGPAAIAYGRLFLTGASGLVAVNQSNGASLWYYKFAGFGYSESTPAVGDRLVFVGGGTTGDIPDPTIYAINATDGQLVWKFQVGVAANSSPAIASGAVYVGASDGRLYAIISQNSQAPILGLEFLIPAVAGLTALVAIILTFRRRSRTGQEPRRGVTS